MGEWVYQKKNDHVCAKPSYGVSVKVGDIYRCDCRKL